MWESGKKLFNQRGGGVYGGQNVTVDGNLELGTLEGILGQ